MDPAARLVYGFADERRQKGTPVTIPFNIVFGLFSGLFFANCARAQLRARDEALTGPVVASVLLYSALILWPAAAYCYLAHPAWSWMYTLDPASVPVLAVVLVLAADLGAILGGLFVGAKLVRMQKRLVLFGALAGTGVASALVVAVWSRRIFSYGSYAQFHDGRAVALASVKLGYVLIALGAGVLSALAFVGWSLFTWGRRVAPA